MSDSFEDVKGCYNVALFERFLFTLAFQFSYFHVHDLLWVTIIKETKKSLNINQYLVLLFLSYFRNRKLPSMGFGPLFYQKKKKKLPSMLVKEWLIMLYSTI